jgi:glutamyl-Q tRNA(Asp) synthetase
VVRGMDLFNATSLHRLLQHLLCVKAPNYRHHHLLRDGAGNKLSKSTRAKSIRSIRADGLTPADLRSRFHLD